MNRRGFLKFLGGGLVASATMAEAGAFAEFLDWIKRAPSWSFPSRRPMSAATLDEISAITLEHIRANVIFDNLFRESPFHTMLRMEGGTHLEEPFVYEPKRTIAA